MADEQTCEGCIFGRAAHCYWPFEADDDGASSVLFDPMPHWAENALENNGGERVSDRLDCAACPCFDAREVVAPESERCPDTPDMFKEKANG